MIAQTVKRYVVLRLIDARLLQTREYRRATPTKNTIIILIILFDTITVAALPGNRCVIPVRDRSHRNAGTAAHITLETGQQRHYHINTKALAFPGTNKKVISVLNHMFAQNFR